MPAKTYTNNLYRKFKYFATWEPNSPIKLGAIGKLRGNVFIPQDNLANVGIAFNPSDPDDSKGDMKYQTEGSVSINKKLAGQAPVLGSVLTEADAGFSIDFKKEKAIIFEAKGTKTTRIDNQIAVGQEIENRYKSGDWQKDWVVVTEVINADTATILISKSKNTHVDLKANAAVGAEKLDIANAEIGLSFVGQHDMTTEFVAKEGLTPLFRLCGIRRGTFDPKGEGAPAGKEEEEAFGEIAPEIAPEIAAQD